MEPERLSITSPDGTRLAGAVFSGGPGPAALIVHGLDSRGDNHHDFARLLAGRGLTAMTIDLRGHGDSAGQLDAGTPGDLRAALDHLAGLGHAPLGLRGSSLGGFLSVLVGGTDERVRAIVAVATARGASIARRLGQDWPAEADLGAAARSPGRARLYIHARGDEVVPWGHSMQLAGTSPPPVRLRVEMGGDHRSLQHDPAIQERSADFLVEHLRA